MSDHEDTNELWDAAERLPDGPARVALLEDAVRRAGYSGDVDLEYRVRMALVEAACRSGQAATMLTSLAWCLAVFDKQPHRYDLPTLLHSCTYALAYISSFPEVSRAQIEELLDSVEHRFQVSSCSTRMVCQWRCFNAFWMGDVDRAGELFQHIWTLPLDEHSSDDSYFALFRTDYHLHMNEDEKALAVAEPRLANHHDWIYPWLTAYSLQALVRTGRIELARQIQRQSSSRLAHHAKSVEHAGHHLHCLLALGELDQAVKLYERHHRWADDAPPRIAFEFFVGTWGVCRHLVRANKADVRLSVPREFHWAEASGALTAADFEPQIGRHVRDLARQFNRRNQNDYFDRLLEKFQRLQDSGG